jgi:hypothetical protein
VGQYRLDASGESVLVILRSVLMLRAQLLNFVDSTP